MCSKFWQSDHALHAGFVAYTYDISQVFGSPSTAVTPCRASVFSAVLRLVSLNLCFKWSMFLCCLGSCNASKRLECIECAIAALWDCNLLSSVYWIRLTSFHRAGQDFLCVHCAPSRSPSADHTRRSTPGRDMAISPCQFCREKSIASSQTRFLRTTL